jgi:hypothetical protein
MKCPKCERRWPEGLEQAACVAVYGRCIVCCSRLRDRGGVECYINGKWMPLYDKEEGRPTLFDTEGKRDAKRAELRKRR